MSDTPGIVSVLCQESFGEAFAGIASLGNQVFWQLFTGYLSGFIYYYYIFLLLWVFNKTISKYFNLQKLPNKSHFIDFCLNYNDLKIITIFWFYTTRNSYITF